MKQLFMGVLALLAIGLAFFNFSLRSTAQANSAAPLRSATPEDETASPQTQPEDGPLVIEDSMHEFMEYVFQPTYRRLKVTMATEPESNSGWKAMKSDALILAESCNLLFPRTPDEDGDDWKKFSADSRTYGADLYQAARAKDFDKATGAYKMMLNSCNACHRQFENGKHILKP